MDRSSKPFTSSYASASASSSEDEEEEGMLSVELEQEDNNQPPPPPPPSHDEQQQQQHDGGAEDDIESFTSWAVLDDETLSIGRTTPSLNVKVTNAQQQFIREEEEEEEDIFRSQSTDGVLYEASLSRSFNEVNDDEMIHIKEEWMISKNVTSSSSVVQIEKEEEIKKSDDHSRYSSCADLPKLVLIQEGEDDDKEMIVLDQQQTIYEHAITPKPVKSTVIVGTTDAYYQTLDVYQYSHDASLFELLVELDYIPEKYHHHRFYQEEWLTTFVPSMSLNKIGTLMTIWAYVMCYGKSTMPLVLTHAFALLVGVYIGRRSLSPFDDRDHGGNTRSKHHHNCRSCELIETSKLSITTTTASDESS